MSDEIQTNNESASAKATADKLKELEGKAEEYLNGWKRERADFLNYKKDEGERISNMADYAQREMILRMLPIVDNISRAAQHIPEKESEWAKGFLAIENQSSEFLKRLGVEEIKTVGEPFDPNYMEAIEEEDGEASGVVVKEFEKGYTVNGKLIRPAKVKISK
jgi:molecular chaperone GrpE